MAFATEVRVDNKNTQICVLKVLSEISSVMRQFHLSKSVVALLAWSITSGNFVRIFCHLHRMRAELFTLPTS